MIELTEKNFKEELEEYSGLIAVDIYADWCAPCKMLAPILSELESEMQSVRFAKINVDREPRLAELFRVDSIPMVAIVKDNTFLDMSIGLVGKEELKKLISEYL